MFPRTVRCIPVYVRYDKGFMALYTEMQSTKHSIFVHSDNDYTCTYTQSMNIVSPYIQWMNFVSHYVQLMNFVSQCEHQVAQLMLRTRHTDLLYMYFFTQKKPIFYFIRTILKFLFRLYNNEVICYNQKLKFRYLQVYLCLIDARSKAVEKVALNISCDIL